MRKKLTLGAIFALLLAVSGIAVASASPAGTSSSDRGGGRVEVMQLVSKTAQETPGGEEQPVLGDEFAFSDDLFRNGEKVGILGGAGTVVRTDEQAGSATVQLVVTAQLRDGQITTQGLATFMETGAGEPFRLAITGGTGRYRTAHGEVVVTETSDPDTVLIKVLIIR
jgi:hypothetical protein